MPKSVPMNSPATNITSLTLTNLEVSKRVLHSLSHYLLPQLFALELNNLHCQNKDDNDILNHICHGLHSLDEENLFLMRLKVANMDLSK